MKKIVLLYAIIIHIASQVAAQEQVKSVWSLVPEESKKKIIFIVRHAPTRTLELQEASKRFRDIINSFDFFKDVLKDQIKSPDIKPLSSQELAKIISPEEQLKLIEF